MLRNEYIHSTGHLLREAGGYLSGGVGIEPGNVLPHHSTVVLQPDLVDLTLGCRLIKRYLNVGQHKDRDSNPKKGIRLKVYLLKKFVAKKTRGLRKCHLNEVRDRPGEAHECVSCGAVDVQSGAIRSFLEGLTESNGGRLTEEDICEIAKEEQQQREGSSVSHGRYRTKQYEKAVKPSGITKL